MVNTDESGTGWWPRLHSNKAALVFLVVGIVSSGIWLWSSGLYYRSLPRIGCAAYLPPIAIHVTSQKQALHLLMVRDRSSRPASFHLTPQTGFGRSSYPDGSVSAMGFTVALLPKSVGHICYIVPPYAALVIPYWFISGLCALGLLNWLYRAVSSAALVGSYAREHHCLRCRYDLRGSPSGQCPECGYSLADGPV